MSELIQQNDNRATIRWKLLTGASALALTVTVASASIANADDADRPLIWIELGGQAERVGDTAQQFAPPFFGNTPAADLAPMVRAQEPPPFSVGLDGKISFTPENSDWVLSAAIRYGKSSAQRHDHQQTALPYVKRYFGTQIFAQPFDQIFGDGQTNFKESHLVADFEVGKDVGLGLFGPGGKSVFSAGVRFARFVSNMGVSLHARPHYTLGAPHSATYSFYTSSPPPLHRETVGYRTVDLFRHTYAASLRSARQAHAIGPTVSWNASLPVAGNSADMTLNIDWGINGALLFGRQRTRVKHQTSGQHFSQTGGPFKYPYQHRQSDGYVHGPYNRTRSRNVTIPNLGGFAGMSLQFPNAKVSLGYRADVFFSAMDGGIDTRKEQNRSFMGPYASISIGLGD